MPHRLNQWIMALLLAASQTALLVHGADFSLHVDSEDCTACLLAHGVDGSAAAHTQALTLPVKQQNHAPAYAAAQPRHSAYLPPSRAPPH